MISCFQSAISSIRGALILRFDLQLHGCDFGEIKHDRASWINHIVLNFWHDDLTTNLLERHYTQNVHSYLKILKKTWTVYRTQFPISHIYSSEVPSIVWGIESAFCFELGCRIAHSLHFGGTAHVCKWWGDGKSREICQSFVPLIRWCIATRTSSTFKVWRMISLWRSLDVGPWLLSQIPTISSSHVRID